MKKITSKRKIPEFKSYEEEAKFWDTHDTTEFLEEFRSVNVVYRPDSKVETVDNFDVLDNIVIQKSYLLEDAKRRVKMRKSTVQKKGQVTLPTEIRRELGIRPGDEVVFELVEEGVLIKPEKIERLERFNQLLAEMNQILEEEETERGESLSLEEMIEGVREERGKILKEKYGLDYQDD